MNRRSFLLLCLSSAALIGLRSPVFALSGRGIRDIAQQITVQVQGAGTSGSGVLIYRTQSKYFVLTAKHVVSSTQSGEEAYIRTHEGQLHPIQTESILSLSGVDTALVSFESDRDYPLATVGRSTELVETDTVYVSGFPLPGNAITESTFTITKGVISGLGVYERGYGLVYDSVTQAGMSGGPVLNASGQLVGIHGLAEGERLQGIPVKAGFNLGIPIRIILGLIPLPIQVSDNPVDMPSDTASESSNPLESESVFRQRLNRYYAALPKLIEQRDAQRLYDYMPIQKEAFRYTTRTGDVQTFTSRIIGATQFYQKSLARGEQWTISYDQISVEMTHSDQAQVSHVETVKWSIWPGLIRGVAKRKETYQWHQRDGDWWIIAGSEQLIER